MRPTRWTRAVAYAVACAALALTALLLVVQWREAGDRVPVHWSSGSGTPDRYASKLEGTLVGALAFGVPVGVFVPIAGLTRPRTAMASLFVLWVLVTGFVTAVLMATVGQTVASTAVGRSGWFSEAVLATLVTAGVLGGVAGYAVAGRPPPDPRRRWLPPPQPPYWFKAKRYGYGWSRPLTWQGWLAMGTYAVAVVTPALVGDPDASLVALLVGTPVLLWLCLRHGEPASWRWGG